jgi:hypothetical protein
MAIQRLARKKEDQAMKTFTIVRTISSPLEKVWKLAGDFTRTPGPGVTIEVHGTGNANAHGVGAERTITIGSVKVRERLESIDPAKKTFTYCILSGAPMKNHSATAECFPQGSATRVRMNVQFDPKVPGTGWVVALITKNAVNRYLDAVEAAARK